MARRPIWLVGMMGAGKSSVGRALAARLELDFADSDGEIERREGVSIGEIFEQRGEAHFRAIESEVIGALAGRGGVVALGGGAAVQPGAIERLAGSGTLVYLRARPETLLERVGSGESRPLLRGLTRKARLDCIVALQQERESSYARSRITIETDQKPLDVVVGEIVERLEGRDRDAGDAN